MLKDRVQITDKGFRVRRSTEPERELYYKEFTLSERPDNYERLQKTEYWNPAIPADMSIGGKRFIMIAEKIRDKVVETYCFYFCPQKTFPTMTITVKPIRNYGKGARAITIRWETREKISNYYIYLKNTGTGEKYLFLTELIAPLSDSQSEDKYIFYPEEGVPEDQYEVVADPLLRQKYQVTIHS